MTPCLNLIAMSNDYGLSDEKLNSIGKRKAAENIELRNNFENSYDVDDYEDVRNYEKFNHKTSMY